MWHSKDITEKWMLGEKKQKTLHSEKLLVMENESNFKILVSLIFNKLTLPWVHF